jgi:hypothetical protein
VFAVLLSLFVTADGVPSDEDLAVCVLELRVCEVNTRIPILPQARKPKPRLAIERRDGHRAESVLVVSSPFPSE